MIDVAHEPETPDAVSDGLGRHMPRTVHASRARTPRACGCGRAVAYDLEKQEFFCVGCGASRKCLCLRSRVSGLVRPVNVA